MRIGILGDMQGWHAAQIAQAAIQRGHQAIALDFRRLAMGVGQQNAPLWEPDQPEPESLIVRTMPAGGLEQVVFRMNLLGLVGRQGIPVLNPARCLEICIDKFLASAECARAGIPVPRLEVCQTSDQAMAGWERLGRDTIVKPLFGSEGRGMLRVGDEDLAWRVFTTIERLGQVIYLQEFVNHPGWDLRVLILGGKILGAIKRHGLGHWRTNVAKGGKAEQVPVEEEPAALALAACKTVGAHFAGVDLVQNPEGKWLLLEVNGVPGFRAFGKATGMDVASILIEFMEKNDP